MRHTEANIFIIPIGVGSSLLLWLSMYKDEIYSPFTDNETYNDAIALILLCSFLYFTIDFILMIVRYDYRNNIYFLHHTIGIVSILFVYFKYYQFIKFLLSYLMFELSTPFLNISLSYRRHNIYNITSILMNVFFVVTYTFVRIIFGTYLWISVIPIIYELNYGLSTK